MDILLQTEQLDDIQTSFNEIKKLHGKANMLDIETKLRLNIKLNILYSNLEIIKENMIDLYSDLDNMHCHLSNEIKEACHQQAQLKKVAKDLFPIFMTHFINNNICYPGAPAGP